MGSLEGPPPSNSSVPHGHVEWPRSALGKFHLVCQLEDLLLYVVICCCAIPSHAGSPEVDFAGSDVKLLRTPTSYLVPQWEGVVSSTSSSAVAEDDLVTQVCPLILWQEKLIPASIDLRKGTEVNKNLALFHLWLCLFKWNCKVNKISFSFKIALANKKNALTLPDLSAAFSASLKFFIYLFFFYCS